MKRAENIFWLAVNAYHEARGESYSGQKAVCHVVLNRARQRAKTVKEIVLAPWQFSWHNGEATPPIKNYNAFIVAMKAASATIREQESGETMGEINHYFNPRKVVPAWADKMTFVARIGAHDFYYDNGGRT